MVESRIAYEAQQAAAFVAGKFDDHVMSANDMDDINTYMQTHGLNINSEATRLMSAQLEEMGILPELIYNEYGNDAALSAHGGGDNRYNQSEVNGLLAAEDTPFEQMLAQGFADHFDAISGLYTRQTYPDLWNRANGQLDNVSQEDFTAWRDGEYSYGNVNDVSEEREGAEAALVAVNDPGLAEGSFVLSELHNGRPVEYGAAQEELRENQNLTPLQREALEFIAANESGISAMNTVGRPIDTTTHFRGWNGLLPDRIAGFNPEQLTMFARNLGTNIDIAQNNQTAEEVLATATAPLDGVAVPPVGQDIAPTVATNPDGSVLHKDAQQRFVYQINYPNSTDYTVFGRDSNGNLTNVQASDGSFSYSLVNGAWQDAEGHAATQMTVNTDGSFAVNLSDGTTETHRTDGSVITSQTASHRVTELERTDGTTMRFTYDGSGQLISVDPGYGEPLTRVGATNRWMQPGVNNAEPWNANPSVDAQGNYSFTQPNGEHIVIGPNGLSPVTASSVVAEQATGTGTGGTAEGSIVSGGPVGSNHDIAVNLNSFQDTRAFLWRDISDADGTFKTADEIRAAISRYGADSRAGQSLNALLAMYSSIPNMDTQNVNQFMETNLRSNPGDRIALVSGGGGPSAVIASVLGRTPTSAEIATIMAANGYDSPSQWASMASGQRFVIPESIR